MVTFTMSPTGFLSRDPIGYLGSKGRLDEFLSGNSFSSVDPLGLADFIFEPNPWNSPIPWQSTTFGAPYQTGYRGMTIPDEGSIQCKCMGGDGSFKLQCDITIKISKILINENELNKEMTYNHEMLHVRNYHELGNHYKGILEDLENENRFCGSDDCESFKNSSLEILQELLQKDFDEEAQHLNYPDPLRGNYYPGLPGLPVMPPNPGSHGGYP